MSLIIWKRLDKTEGSYLSY